MAATLANCQSGGCFTPINRSFWMVAWPADAPAWQFLEMTLPKVPSGAAIRFIVRRTVPDLEYPKGKRSRIVEFEGRHRGQYKNTSSHVYKELAGEPPINAVFREQYGITYDQLVAPNGSLTKKISNSFFLCFSPLYGALNMDFNIQQIIREQISNEQDVLTQFLQANGAQSILRMMDEGVGAWDLFRKNVNHGCIIVSQSLGTW